MIHFITKYIQVVLRLTRTYVSKTKYYTFCVLKRCKYFIRYAFKISIRLKSPVSIILILYFILLYICYIRSTKYNNIDYDEVTRSSCALLITYSNHENRPQTTLSTEMHCRYLFTLNKQKIAHVGHGHFSSLV